MSSTPTLRTVGDFLDAHERERPDAPALNIDDQRITYAELAAAVREAAGYLHAQAGVRRGEHVALLMANSVDAAVWLLAGATLGCAAAPLNTRLGPAELAYQVRHSDSAVLITAGEDHLKTLESAIGRDGALSTDCPRLRQVIALDKASRPRVFLSADRDRETAPSPASPKLASPADVLIIQYTSGTTAFPKGVLLTQQQILTNAAGVAARLELTGADRICSPSPFFHVAGTTLLLFLGLVSGAAVYSFGGFDPAQVITTIEREQITVYNGVETFFIGLLKHPDFVPERLRSIRTGWIAASAELVQQVHEEMGLTGIVNVYGISEASPNVTIANPQAPLEERCSCGQPHSGTEVRIVDAVTRHPLREENSGIIEVRGPSVMKGYYKAPEETAKVLGEDGWLHTGDRGHLDVNGNLIYEGRSKDMLRVGGENVAPAEIEAVLLSHPGIAEAAVIGVPHHRLIEVPAAFVAPHEGRTVTPDEVTAFVEDRLASYKVPRQVYVLDHLPMTGSGKIQKYQLIKHVRD